MSQMVDGGWWMVDGFLFGFGFLVKSSRGAELGLGHWNSKVRNEDDPARILPMDLKHQ